MISSLPSSLRIGVLRGGPSPEYDVSLQSGAHVLKHLSTTHRPLDIFISKDGNWHMHGVARSPERILKHVDVAFNALHGTYGEDGKVQQILEHHGVPYTGSDRLSSALAMNKWMAKEQARKVGIKTPLSALVRRSDPLQETAKHLFFSIPHPLVVKPISSGSSIGLYLTQTLTDLSVALETILSLYENALVEEYISGREATCGVIDDFRGMNIYSLPVVEIIPPENKTFFDYHSKYSGESREMCPGNFTMQDKKEIERLSALVHSTLGLSHYSRSDFIVSPRRGIFFLEVNSLPGMTSECTFPKSLEAVGVSQTDFIHHVLKLAMEGK